MLIADAFTLARYWTKHPPTHVLLAGLLGVGTQGAARTPSEDELRQVAAGLG